MNIELIIGLICSWFFIGWAILAIIVSIDQKTGIRVRDHLGLTLFGPTLLLLILWSLVKYREKKDAE